MFNSILILWNN